MGEQCPDSGRQMDRQRWERPRGSSHSPLGMMDLRGPGRSLQDGGREAGSLVYNVWVTWMCGGLCMLLGGDQTWAPLKTGPCVAFRRKALVVSLDRLISLPGK